MVSGLDFRTQGLNKRHRNRFRRNLGTWTVQAMWITFHRRYIWKCLLHNFLHISTKLSTSGGQQPLRSSPCIPAVVSFRLFAVYTETGDFQIILHNFIR